MPLAEEKEDLIRNPVPNERPTPRKNRWLPDYRTVWRWHFYAGLFTLPFVIVLSISGSIYLFKPQIEAWIDRSYDQLVFNQPASVEEQVKAAMASVPGSIPSGYELPASHQSASRVLVRKNSDTIRVYVHPESLAILNSVPENERLMKSIFRLHGELWMGDRGSNLVELASSWTIIMILSGLYLWWPRNSRGLGGILFPRWWKGSRIVWRDLHSVTGFWISALALFLLITGLPWAKFWGNYFKTIRTMTGTSSVQQEWTTGSDRSTKASGKSAESSDHGGHGQAKGGWAGKAEMPKDMSGFDKVAQAVVPLGLEYPVVIAPPKQGSDKWTAKSLTPNRPNRVNLVINGKTGEIISRDDFNDKHWVDRMVSIGIAAHEGQLFGWPNQLLGLLTAAGLVLLSFSGIVMWWHRRSPGVLGTPSEAMNPHASRGLLLFAVIFGIYLPMFGASLVLVLLIEFGLRRIRPIRNWLGLRGATLNLTTADS